MSSYCESKCEKLKINKLETSGKSNEKNVQVKEDQFGSFTDKKTGETKPVTRFTWKNNNNIEVAVVTYGATITSIKVPNKDGQTDDIVLGFDNMEGYLNPQNPYFGATVGRVANRIGNAQFKIGDTNYNVTPNYNNKHMLHGGTVGFDKVNWNFHQEDKRVIMSYHSQDLEEGFPGDLVVNVSFELTSEDELIVQFKAMTTKPTYVNLTNHSYFNLAGHNKGAKELYQHVVVINADKITETDEDSIPTGRLLPVGDTVFDLRTPKILGDVITEVPNTPGFDQNFCINKGSNQDETFISRIFHPSSGRALEVYSNQPGVQFYNAGFMPEDAKKCEGGLQATESLIGKGGSNYYKHGAFCLETQNYPDAVNHKTFPKAVLNPGEVYHHVVRYKFFTGK